MAFFVYCLKQIGGNKTYIGYTINPENRLKQHNGEKSGGAKYTRGNKWEFAFIISGFETSQNALQCEWRLKNPYGRRKRGKYSGILSRLDGLRHCVKDEYWTNQVVISNEDCSYTVYLEQSVFELFNKTFPNYNDEKPAWVCLINGFENIICSTLPKGLEFNQV